MGIDILASSDAGDDGADDLSTITIDAAYARRLEHNKNREALHRLKELQNEGRAGDSSDSDSDSDSPASPSAERDFIRKLILVKQKDPILTQPDLRLFDPADDSDGAAVPKKSKPLYLKDVNARHLLESGPELDDDVDKPALKNSSRIYKSEQADSIRAFLQAEKAVLESGDGDDFMKEKEKERADADEEPDSEHEFDKFFGKDDELDDGEKFLKGYLKDRKWIDKEKKVTFDIDVSEDEDALDKQDKYEASYNFRYEEPEQTERVLGHARVIEGSVRKKLSSRKTQRKSKEERMAQAEFEQKAELKHLKNLKKKEIQEKLEKVRAIAGIGEGGKCKLGAEDLEEDFDPEEYDKKMRDIFGDDYYEENDADPGFGTSDDEGDTEKPDFGKEDKLLGLPEGWDGSGAKDGFAAARERYLKQKGEEEHEEEPEKEEGKKKKKKKQKISLKEKVELEKEFEEEPEKEEGKKKKNKKHKISLKEKVELEKEFEEYYKLDYEDTIEDLKTRFKYKPVMPNRFGLNSKEIWMADEKNLNQYVSLKKLAPYREQEWEVTYHQKKRKPEILQIDPGKISKKHRRTGGESSAEAERKPANDGNDALSKRSKRRHRQKELQPSLSRLVAFGKVEPKSHKNR